MKCITCGNKSKKYSSRTDNEGVMRKSYYRCTECGLHFIIYEISRPDLMKYVPDIGIIDRKIENYKRRTNSTTANNSWIKYK